jgi:hypothetical protein
LTFLRASFGVESKPLQSAKASTRNAAEFNELSMGTLNNHIRRIGFFAAIASQFASGRALAQLEESGHAENHSPHEHVPLAIDGELGWPELLERTLVNYPRYAELAAREVEAGAWSLRGQQLLAAQPSLSLSYLSDNRLDDYGLAEYETVVHLPLWRLGQRRAARAVGASALDESSAARRALRWELEGSRTSWRPDSRPVTCRSRTRCSPKPPCSIAGRS